MNHAGIKRCEKFKKHSFKLLLSIMLLTAHIVTAQKNPIESAYRFRSKKALIEFLHNFSFTNDILTEDTNVISKEARLSCSMFSWFHGSGRYNVVYPQDQHSYRENIVIYDMLPGVYMLPKIYYSDSEEYVFAVNYLKSSNRYNYYIDSNHLDTARVLDWIISELGPNNSSVQHSKLQRADTLTSCHLYSCISLNRSFLSGKTLDSVINDFVFKYPNKKKRIRSRLKFIHKVISSEGMQSKKKHCYRNYPYLLGIYFDEQFQYVGFKYRTRYSVCYDIFDIKLLHMPNLVKHFTLIVY